MKRTLLPGESTASLVDKLETYKKSYRETLDAPPSITGEGKAYILLRSGDFETPGTTFAPSSEGHMSFILHTVILAYDIDLRVGHANVVVPDVITGESFSLVCK